MSNIDNSKTRKKAVLVTGASGFLGAHCVKQLLNCGYSVVGTVRSLQNKLKVQPLLDLASSFPKENFKLIEADLNNKECWKRAIFGCSFVLHVASPFPIEEDETIVKIAVEGTLNVLEACADINSNVKKVILTSSCAAINEGHENENRTFSEEDWTITENTKKVLSYSRSKTEAEKAAWNFIKNFKEGDNKFKLTCLNPTLIVGPVLIDIQGTSITILRRFLNNEMPLVPALQLALVDVTDVARAHILAMNCPESDNQRILITAQPKFGKQGYWLPSYQAPYFGVWLYSFFDLEARQVLSRLNRHIHFDNTKAKKLLGIEFRNPEASLIDMAYSMIERVFSLSEADFLLILLLLLHSFDNKIFIDYLFL
ncbi:3Beta_HSD domain-containing protein [Meloidogyne graminicola]|uniref:3Beta_HSD domain-containing protein n=1 Tax=Meloidogyne graminicola TaxID=189291 RepID=A0A8S9ZXA9_9BILA|nr:3Beta_HSD domain-containing protein [Meloidogyne graminicola]